MWISDKDFYGAMAIVGLIGWGVIEALVWLFSHIHIGWTW